MRGLKVQDANVSRTGAGWKSYLSDTRNIRKSSNGMLQISGALQVLRPKEWEADDFDEYDDNICVHELSDDEHDEHNQCEKQQERIEFEI